MVLTTLSCADQTPARRGVPGDGRDDGLHRGFGVAEVAKQSAALTMPAEAPRAFLAADVGGTHARIGLVRRDAAGQPVSVLAYQRYACAEWSSLTAILEDFVAHVAPPAPIEQCAVASAGYVLGDAIVNDNLPWPVSIREIRERLGLARLAVVNDFEAVAYATQFLSRCRHACR